MNAFDILLMVIGALLLLFLISSPFLYSSAPADHEWSLRRITRDIDRLRVNAVRLKARTPEEERQIRFIFEHLRIAQEHADYATRLLHGPLPSIFLSDDELEWTIGASELTMKFAARRMYEFELNVLNT